MVIRLMARRGRTMVKTFKVGDHVSWNSEAGRVRGKIVKVHKRDVNYKGHVHHATPNEPQYEIKSDKTDHIALHKAAVLKHNGAWRSRSSQLAIPRARSANLSTCWPHRKSASSSMCALFRARGQIRNTIAKRFPGHCRDFRSHII